MNKFRYHNRLWLCLLVVGAGYAPSHASLGLDPSARVGRDNPFAAMVAASKPAVAQQSTNLEEKPDLFLETAVLKFLDATSLKPVLDQMITPYGSVAVNMSNNAMIMCDTRESLTRILDEIRKADRTPQQIMVEVMILDVQLKDDQDVGLNWDMLSDNRYDISYRQNLTASRLTSTIEDETTIGSASAFNTVGFGGDFSVISGTIRHVLHLVQQKRDVNILANPRTLVISGKSATIRAVEEIPYQEVSDTAAGGEGALTSTQFKDVGVTLLVTATVADGNDILVTVTAEQSVRTGASQAGVPVVDTRKADTSLLLKDGQIVVIGGLRREEKTQQVSQVPILGDLPLIGLLFRNTNTITTKSELAVLLSPHLHRGEPVPASVGARYDAIRREDWLSNEKDKKVDSPSEGG